MLIIIIIILTIHCSRLDCKLSLWPLLESTENLLAYANPLMIEITRILDEYVSILGLSRILSRLLRTLKLILSSCIGPFNRLATGLLCVLLNTRVRVLLSHIAFLMFQCLDSYYMLLCRQSSGLA